jgi:hypothetical protein
MTNDNFCVDTTLGIYAVGSVAFGCGMIVSSQAIVAAVNTLSGKSFGAGNPSYQEPAISLAGELLVTAGFAGSFIHFGSRLFSQADGVPVEDGNPCVEVNGIFSTACAFGMLVGAGLTVCTRKANKTVAQNNDTYDSPSTQLDGLYFDEKRNRYNKLFKSSFDDNLDRKPVISFTEVFGSLQGPLPGDNSDGNDYPDYEYSPPCRMQTGRY